MKNKVAEMTMIKKLAREYKLLISYEGKAPRKYREFLNPLPVDEFHNLLAFSKIYIGPGATSASESAMLGTPAVYTNHLPLGYISELERLYHLVFHRISSSAISDTVDIILNSDSNAYRKSRDKMLRNSCDVAKFVADSLSNALV